MYDNLNVSKLPLLYDSFKNKGYNKSYDEFVEELLKLLITNKSSLSLNENNNISLNISADTSKLIELANYFDELNTLKDELSLYENQELTIAKENYKIAVEWGKKNHIKLKPIAIQSFSDLYTNLVPLSSFFIHHD